MVGVLIYDMIYNKQGKLLLKFWKTFSISYLIIE